MAEVLSHEAARAVYDRIGRWQDTQAFYEDPCTRRMLAELALERAERVVEFGCGTGRLAAKLLADTLAPEATYLALDQSPTMLRVARERLERFGDRVEVRATDGGPRIDAPDASSDRVLSSYVFDLLSLADIRAVIGEAHRVLAPGGRLGLVSLTRGSRPHERLVISAIERLWRLNPKLIGGCRPVELLAELDGARWRVVHHEVVSPFGIPSEVLVAEALAAHGDAVRAGGRDGAG